MKRLLIFFVATSLMLSSCTMPGSDAPSPDVATAAAQTVEAAINNNQSPLPSPTADSVLNLEQATNVASSDPNSKPFASFEDVTNCRTGPGVDYERITQIQPGFAVEIVGFYPPNYWIVSTDKGQCWVPGEFVTPSGGISAVPTVTAPPTPIGGVPDAPAFLKSNGWSFFCGGTGQADITLNWSDKATNETGYRVIRNNEIIAELPADSTTFSESITLLSGQSVGYQIQAYNTAGKSTSSVASMTCP